MIRKMRRHDLIPSGAVSLFFVLSAGVVIIEAVLAAIVFLSSENSIAILMVMGSIFMAFVLVVLFLAMKAPKWLYMPVDVVNGFEVNEQQSLDEIKSLAKQRRLLEKKLLEVKARTLKKEVDSMLIREEQKEAFNSKFIEIFNNDLDQTSDEREYFDARYSGDSSNIKVAV